MTAATRLRTYEDLEALPEDVRAEILGGEIVVQPSPVFDHGFIQAGLSHFIGGPFGFGGGGGEGGWWIVVETDVRFSPHDVTRPDLAGWRRARLPSPWGRRPIEVVPDWVCEVLSPTTAQRDRVYKQQLYARHGVPHYWLIDPAVRTLEAYVLAGEQWVVAGTYDHTAVARIAPFEAIELSLARLFPPDPPKE